jgi:hypothetical protein
VKISSPITFRLSFSLPFAPLENAVAVVAIILRDQQKLAEKGHEFGLLGVAKSAGWVIGQCGRF